MRPRSRLLSKRRLLLPTIREGTEEAVKDLNEANTLHISGHAQPVSSEDYLLSICHLAHPTFPTRDVSPYSRRSLQADAADQRLQLSRLSSPSADPEFSYARELCATPHGDGEELEVEIMYSNSDPLEYLYGHRNNPSGGAQRAVVEGAFIRQHGSLREGRPRSRAHSIPHVSSPELPRQRKSSFPDLHTRSGASFPNISPKRSSVRSEVSRESPAGRGAEEERQTPIKQSLICQWISDCRSAWRVARARACMLPAIAEV